MTTIKQVSSEKLAEILEQHKLRKCSVMRRFFQQTFCQHKERLMVWEDYQDRYVETVCVQCGKHIYEDI